MSVQYQTVVSWDPKIIDVEFVDTDTAPQAIQGLAKYAVQIVTGAPTATAGKWLPGATISNAIDATAYLQTGSVSAPSWKLISHA